nr:reverse transcriptase domain-containing protein [Tanacetum cinerariifolium]
MKRGQAPERNKAIYKEVEKLVDAGIIKEVHFHSWLFNPVMVERHDERWVCGFQRLKQSLSQRWLSVTRNRLDGRVPLWVPFQMLPGCICQEINKGMQQLPGSPPSAKKPATNLTHIASLWPFYKWGIDIAKPFLEGPGKVKFLMVEIDYFTKWIEAKPMVTITRAQGTSFTEEMKQAMRKMEASLALNEKDYMKSQKHWAKEHTNLETAMGTPFRKHGTSATSRNAMCMKLIGGTVLAEAKAIDRVVVVMCRCGTANITTFPKILTMSTNEQTPVSQPTSIVRNKLGKEQVPPDLNGPAFDAALRESPKPRRGHFKSSRKRGSERKMVFKRVEKVYSTGLETRGRVHPQTQTIQCIDHTTVAAETLKAATRVLAQKKQSLHMKNIITKEHPRKRLKHHQKVRMVQEDTGSQSQRGKGRVLRMTYPNHGDVKGAPKCMKISRFMHGITNPELIKRLHDKIPKSMDEIMRVTTTFLRGGVVSSNREQKKSFPSWKQQEAKKKPNFKKGGFRNQQKRERKQDIFTLLIKISKEILDLDKEKFKPPPPMTILRKIEEMLISRKLSHLIKELKQSSRKDQAKAAKKGETSGKEKPLAILMDETEGLMIIEAEMGGHFVHRMYMDEGSSLEVMYKHCFNRFHPKVRSQMIPVTSSLVRFSGKIIWSLGQILIFVKIGDGEHSTSAWMNFMVVRSPSPYNRKIKRPKVRRIQAVPSRDHEMLKFLMAGEMVTLRSSRIIPLECMMVSGPGVPQAVINQVTEEKIQVAIHPEYPVQTIAIGSTLTEEGRKELCGLLRRNLDIFSWKPANMTRVL